MNRLKLTLGAASACAACCALPLALPIGLAAAAGTSIGAALWLCKEELLLAAGVATLAAAAVWAWRRRQSRRQAVAGAVCGCNQAACATERCRPQA